MTETEPSRCPRCGAARQTLGSADYCPACLLTSALTGEGEACPYQVLGPMAEDASGITYLAQPLVSPRAYVVLKVYEAFDGVDEAIARYNEWRPTLQRLRHPSIGRLIDAGATPDGCLYVATEYVAGRPLNAPSVGAALGEHGRTAIADQLTDALSAAHAAGLLHLNLTASKIIVSTAPAPRATMLGLGVALVVDGTGGEPDQDRRALARILAGL